LHFSSPFFACAVAFSRQACYNNGMKNQNSQKEIFKITFTPLIYVLCVVIYLLCGVGAGVSVWRIVRFGILGFNDVLKYPFLIAVCLFCIALITSVLVRSVYVVDDEYFYTQFGFVKSKFAIKDMTSMLLDREKQKLSVYFGEQFLVLSIKEEWRERFVNAILAVNPKVEYGFVLGEPDKKE
jgi:hypothetical protein